ncbi:type V toxin-antitoxin system endoribonuclease antitoxin GhoS [Entomohabitans teleogrylli]|uniref:type V toxin-antitoxin system endoribonuclease antitoxin GhoS n=1 Tax=Entomohabitans teleogrylli TaxID=1384589 RepID=UPI00073D70F9|nr:type V toxin-antitoxin system endoribonuclease antitoxin GhoS [Entomohabitans teleogrylli]
MSQEPITRYIINIVWQAKGLTPLNELNNHLTRAGFQLTMADDEGKIHDLGPGSYGFVTPLSQQEVTELVTSLATSAIGETPDITITTWEQWRQEKISDFPEP